MTDDILNRPAYTLTAGELVNLLAEKLDIPVKQPEMPAEKKYIHSLGELARILGCSLMTIHNKKRKGVFGDAIKQTGRVLKIDVSLAQERFWNSKKK